MSDSTIDPLDGHPCPDCGITLKSPALIDANATDESRNVIKQPTVYARLEAAAELAHAEIVTLEQDIIADLGGAIAAGYNTKGEFVGLIFLAEDLDEELRLDILAFALATYTIYGLQIYNAPNSYLAIGRDRLPQAHQGPNHLAWHLLWSCGRNAPSTSFELILM